LGEILKIGLPFDHLFGAEHLVFAKDKSELMFWILSAEK